jgi:DNA-binding MarR family transcriptional regulator
MSGDFDPRDVDSRERDDGIHDREDDWLVIGRDAARANPRDDHVDADTRDRDNWLEARDREPRDREDERGSLDPRDVFMRDLDLPRGLEREPVRDRDRDYSLNGRDTRTLSTVGAFRVIAERDLRDSREALDVRHKDLRHLEKQGLIHRVSVDGRERAVVLTDRARALLECHRDRDSKDRQAFYSGADKARERTNDAQVYRTYLKAAERLQEREARILRVELDRELKSEYQRFLQERNRGDRDSDGRPDRSPEEIEEWARDHDLPYFDGQVHFQTCASSTPMATAMSGTTISRSPPLTTEAATAQPQLAPGSRSTAAAVVAVHSIPAWPRTSYDATASSAELEHRSAQHRADRGCRGLRLHGPPGRKSATVPSVLTRRMACRRRRL